MKRLTVKLAATQDKAVPVGTLAEHRGRVYFEYDKDFLEHGRSLSPFRLPFQTGLFEHKDIKFGPIPGVFDDSLPDGFGLMLMVRHFRQIGRLGPGGTSPLDRLAWLGTRTMGALTYHPSSRATEKDMSLLNLHALARQSNEILAGSSAKVLPELLATGGSPGGTKPKVLIGYNENTGEMISGEDNLPNGYDHWLVKFQAKDDPDDFGTLEYRYSLMAKDAGIVMPKTRIFETTEGNKFFGVRRFDRKHNRRFHIHTFGNIIQTNFRVPSADYGDLLKVTALLTRDHSQVLRAFRQAVFNVLAHNRDDHVKNFAFILDLDSGDWKLSPAYDLVFSHGPAGEHSMTVAGEGKCPDRSHLETLAGNAEISKSDRDAIIDEVREAVEIHSAPC